MKYRLLRQIIMLSRLALYGVVVNSLALSVLWASDPEAKTMQSVKDAKVYLDLIILPLWIFLQLLNSRPVFRFSPV